MKTIAAVVATLAIASPALAGGPTIITDEPVITQSYAPAPVATLDWTGMYAGVQLGHISVDSDGAGLDGSDLVAGVHGGYRWDFGGFVAGAELDYDLTSLDLETEGDTLDSVARLKLQGGAEFGNSLIYATTGLARADATVGGLEMSDNGYFLGAGLDMAITDRWTLGGEILQHRFSDFDGSGIDLDATTIKARVALRF